jgi:DNA-binding response OmpR family regulator
MSLPHATSPHKVLIVDDDEVILELTSIQLGKKGFEVVAAGSVTEALKLIATDTFDALITDLNMPDAGDGFTVVTAMRHSQPQALILLVSGYPDVERAMATIALQADEIIVKPFETATLAGLLSEKLLARKPTARTAKQRVSVILERCLPGILTDWLAEAKQSRELNHLNLSDDERTGYLPKLIADLITRLDKSGSTPMNAGAPCSPSAAEHGKLRFRQGYSSPVLVHESRILQVTLFGTLQKNLSHLDFSLLLPDVMKIADEVDAQLTQAMVSFTKCMHEEVAA